MSKVDNDEQIDADILQCKADILRARDIIPGSEKPAKKEKTEESEIPRFDLAEDIMAEHRKVTSGKRKAPLKKTEVTDEMNMQVKPQDRTNKNNISREAMQLASEMEQIVAEIVARDIERLCRGEALSIQ